MNLKFTYIANGYFRGESYMQTKMLAKKPKSAPDRTNNHTNKPTENKENVRTTDYKKLLQIMLNNPYAITREEFIVLQSAIGYRRAVEMREEAIRLKKQRELGQTNVSMNSISLEKSKSGIKKDSEGKKEFSGLKNNDEKNPLQMKKDDGNTATSSSGMPHNLKAGLEKLSGVDLSDVKVHQNSDKPQQVGALAYTQGSDIHIAPGQEKHLPHEGWHAVQQKQGMVKPTLQMKSGTVINDDAGLEKEADVMGLRASQMGSQSSTFQLKESSKINYGRNIGNVIQRVSQTTHIKETKILVLYKGDKYITLYSSDKLGISDKEKEGWSKKLKKKAIDVVYNKTGDYIACSNMGELSTYLSLSKYWSTTPMTEPLESKAYKVMQKSLSLTGSFEGSGYVNVAGNFDGMGLSVGYFQWNIGKGTLQPLLKEFFDNNNDLAKKIFSNKDQNLIGNYTDLNNKNFEDNYQSVVDMLKSSKSKQIKWAKNINEGKQLKKEWHDQFIALCKTSQFQQIQKNAMKQYTDQAYKIANDYNLKTEKGLALALDIAIQNWDVKQSSRISIKNSIKNGASELEVLQLLAQAAVDKSDKKHQSDVKSRKFTIANGTGIVHGKNVDVEKQYGISDQNFR